MLAINVVGVSEVWISPAIELLSFETLWNG